MSTNAERTAVRNRTIAFYLYLDRQGRWRWELVAPGGRIAVSGRGYMSKKDCRESIDLVQGAAAAPVYER